MESCYINFRFIPTVIKAVFYGEATKPFKYKPNRPKMTKQLIFSAVIVNIKQRKLWIWDRGVKTGRSHGCASA